MTRKEIFNEMEACKRKISEINKRFMMETDPEKGRALINEMIETADQMSKLDTLHKKLLLTELEDKKNEILTKLKKRIGLS